MKKSTMKAITAFVLLTSGIMLSCSSNNKGEVTAPRVGLLEGTFMGNTKAVKGHIEFGSDLNMKDEYGSTALNIAVTFGKTEIAKLLIEGGADLNATSADGSTALHTAAFFGHVEVAEAMLKKGVDTQIRNKFGATAYESLLPDFDQLKPVYDQMARDLGPLGLRLDFEAIENARPVIAEMISNYEKTQN